VPHLTDQVQQLSELPRADLERVMQEYDNEKVLRDTVQEIQDHLNEQFREDTN
jgi:phosphopantothenate synthetase